ncbi:MAG: LTA synthase family protein [Lachnospiraceae bacterium]|nr:LTA synthase family protein [Lachnospiraceae bacterium]
MGILWRNIMSKKNKTEKKNIKKVQDIELNTDIIEETEDYNAEVSADMDDAAEDWEEDKDIPFLQRVKNRIRRAWAYSIHTWIFKCLLIALPLELLLEMLGRRSIFLGFKFMVTQPIVFAYNTSIVFFTLLFALFLKKRIFGLIAITTVWLACGIINFCVLSYRVTPFAAIDFLMFLDVFSMLDVYLTKFQQVLLLLAVIAAIVALVILFKKSPRFEGDRKVKGTMLLCVLAWIFVWGMTNFAVKHNIISDDFANLGNAYKDYGFAYCFTNSIIDNGIDKPDDYEEDVMLQIKSELETVKQEGKKQTPNVIVIQLETFFDPKAIVDLDMSQDPVPTYTKFKEEYPSGYLTVPALGAGTANTEFEVLTGFPSGFFGAGEYPYKTTVNEESVEGLCSALKAEGYGAYAIHNNKSSFYDRKNVYEKMGFDAFISLEYMYDLEFTSTGWAKDESLIADIMKCLKETEGQDLVYTISLQAHGKYPIGEDTCEEHISVTYGDDIEVQQQMTYYVNQLYEMDVFLDHLKKELDNYGEDYVLVLYGDHLPTIGLTEEQIPSHSLFQTEYVMVNNIGLKLEDEDILASELSVKLLDALNIEGTYAYKAHAYYDDDVLEDKLRLISYDMLFGDKYMFDNGIVLPVNEMQMGVDIISVTQVTNERDHMVIKGHNFTEYSVVYVGEKDLTTTYVDRQTLLVEGTLAEVGDEITVKQVDKSHHILGSSEVYVFQ